MFTGKWRSVPYATDKTSLWSRYVRDVHTPWDKMSVSEKRAYLKAQGTSLRQKRTNDYYEEYPDGEEGGGVVGAIEELFGKDNKSNYNTFIQSYKPYGDATIQQIERSYAQSAHDAWKESGDDMRNYAQYYNAANEEYLDDMYEEKFEDPEWVAQQTEQWLNNNDDDLLNFNKYL